MELFSVPFSLFIALCFYKKAFRIYFRINIIS